MKRRWQTSLPFAAGFTLRRSMYATKGEYSTLSVTPSRSASITWLQCLLLQLPLETPSLPNNVNFGGTLNILCAWRQLQFDCRLLFVSSVEVYGPPRSEDLPLREDAPFRPANPYAGSKAASEFLALQFFQSYALPIVRVRPFNHTGPRQSDAFFCSSLARQIAEIDAGVRPPTVATGNLEVRRDFSDVRDIVRGYFLLLEKGEGGDVYQLCSGQPVLLESILQSLSSLISKPITVSVDEERVRSAEVPVVWGDPSKTRLATGWTPQFDLETTLHDLKLYWDQRILPGAAATS